MAFRPLTISKLIFILQTNFSFHKQTSFYKQTIVLQKNVLFDKQPFNLTNKLFILQTNFPFTKNFIVFPKKKAHAVYSVDSKAR